MTTRSPRAARILAAPLALLGMALLPTGALANAFPMPAGEGRAMLTVDVSKGGRAYDNAGDPVPIDDFDQTNVYLNAEYGITEDLTVIFAPSLRFIDREGPAPDSNGIGYVETGLRYRVANAGATHVSLQATARFPGERYRDPLAQLTTDSTEYDLRAGVGSGLGANGQAGFAMAEAGYRLRSDDPPNEFRLDATLGLRVAPRLLLIAASYNVWSDGAGSAGFQSYRYHNGYLSAVYDLSDRIALQLGGHLTLAGRNALRERGAFAGLWLKL